MERRALIFRFVPLLIAVALGPVAANSQSIPQSFTYEGRLYDNAGAPLNDNSVTFKFQILSATGTCVLYEETQTVDLSGSSDTAGVFALQVGSVIGAAKRSAGDINLPMNTVFANTGTQIRAADATYCPGGYIPAATDDRVLRVIVDASGTPETLSPDARISAAPYANVAGTLNGYDHTQFVKGTDVPPCVAGEALFFDGASFTCIGVGSGTLTGVTAGTGILVSGSAVNPTISVDVGTTTNKIVQLTGGALPSVSGANLTGLSGAQLTDNTITDGKISGISGGKVSGDITGNAAGFTGSLSGDVTGSQASTSVTKIQGRDVAATPVPSTGQVLTWNGGSSKWEPQSVPSSADNLGNHTATTNIALGSNWLSGDGGAEGIKVDAAGNVAASGNVTVAGNILLSGQISIAGGVPGAGKVLTSDANGLAAWQTPASAGGDFMADGSVQMVGPLKLANDLADVCSAALKGSLQFSTISNKMQVCDGGSWADITPGGGGGGVTSVTASAPLSSSGGSAPDISLSGTIDIGHGGTGATNAADARTNLGLGGAALANVGLVAGRVLGFDDVAICASNQKLTLEGPGPTYTWTCRDITYSDFINGTGVYMTYKPDGTACAAGQTLKWNAGIFNRWECANDNNLTTAAGSAAGVIQYNDGSNAMAASTNLIWSSQRLGVSGGAGGALIASMPDGANSSSFVSAFVNNDITGGESHGVLIQAGNDVGDYALKTTSRAGTDLFNVRGNGNVGIGTASPQAHLDVAGTGAMIVPRGLASERPSPSVNGMIRYNVDAGKFEVYENGAWVNMIGGGGGVTSVGATAPLSVSGVSNLTISLDDSGVTANTYGSGSSVPVLQISEKGIVTNASTAAIAIPASQITQSSAAVNNTLKWNGTTWVPDSVSGALGYTPLNKGGDSMSGDLDMASHNINNVAAPVATDDASTKGYVDASISTAISDYLMKVGDTMSGILDMGSNQITNVADPIDPQDAATRNYVDAKIAGHPVNPGSPVAGDTLVFDGTKWVYTPNPYPQPARLVLFNDFVGGFVDFLAANSLWEHHQFVLSTTGTGSKISFVSPASAADLNHPGIIRLESGTTASGLAAVVGCSVDVSGTGYLSKQFLLGGGPLEYEVMLKYNLTTAGVTYRIGLTNVPDNAPPTKGLWVEHPGGASAQWQYNATGTASTGSVPFGSTAASGAWTKIRISVNSDASEVKFQINNDSPVVISNPTYIPTNPSTDALCPTVLVMNSVSGNKSLDLDYLNLTQTFSTSR